MIRQLGSGAIFQVQLPMSGIQLSNAHVQMHYMYCLRTCRQESHWTGKLFYAILLVQFTASVGV